MKFYVHYRLKKFIAYMLSFVIFFTNFFTSLHAFPFSVIASENQTAIVAEYDIWYSDVITLDNFSSLLWDSSAWNVWDKLSVPVYVDTQGNDLWAFTIKLRYGKWLKIENKNLDVVSGLGDNFILTVGPQKSIWSWEREITLVWVKKSWIESWDEKKLLANIKFEVVSKSDIQVYWKIDDILNWSYQKIWYRNLIEYEKQESLYWKIKQSLWNFVGKQGWNFRSLFSADIFSVDYYNNSNASWPIIWDVNSDCSFELDDLIMAVDYGNWDFSDLTQYWLVMWNVYTSTINSTWISIDDIVHMSNVLAWNSKFLEWVTAVTDGSDIELRAYLIDENQLTVTGDVVLEFEITPIDGNWKWIKYTANMPDPWNDVYYYSYTLSWTDIVGDTEIQVAVHIVIDDDKTVYAWSNYLDSDQLNAWTFSPIASFKPSEITWDYKVIYGNQYRENYWDESHCNIPTKPKVSNLEYLSNTWEVISDTELELEEELTLSYDYSDYNYEKQTGEILSWYRSSSTWEIWTVIYTWSTYTLAGIDVWKYINFSVIPIADIDVNMTWAEILNNSWVLVSKFNTLTWDAVYSSKVLAVDTTDPIIASTWTITPSYTWASVNWIQVIEVNLTWARIIYWTWESYLDSQISLTWDNSNLVWELIWLDPYIDYFYQIHVDDLSWHSASSSIIGFKTLMTDYQAVQWQKEALTFDDIRGDNIFTWAISRDLVLPLSWDNWTSISWSSANSNSITHTWVVVRTDSLSLDSPIPLTATISRWSYSDSEEFILTVSKLKDVTPPVTVFKWTYVVSDIWDTTISWIEVFENNFSWAILRYWKNMSRLSSKIELTWDKSNLWWVITGLEENTTYYYKVEAVDVIWNVWISDLFGFITLINPVWFDLTVTWATLAESRLSNVYLNYPWVQEVTKDLWVIANLQDWRKVDISTDITWVVNYQALNWSWLIWLDVNRLYATRNGWINDWIVRVWFEFENLSLSKNVDVKIIWVDHIAIDSFENFDPPENVDYILSYIEWTTTRQNAQLIATEYYTDGTQKDLAEMEGTRFISSNPAAVYFDAIKWLMNAVSAWTSSVSVETGIWTGTVRSNEILMTVDNNNEDIVSFHWFDTGDSIPRDVTLKWYVTFNDWTRRYVTWDRSMDNMLDGIRETISWSLASSDPAVRSSGLDSVWFLPSDERGDYLLRFLDVIDWDIDIMFNFNWATWDSSSFDDTWRWNEAVFNTASHMSSDQSYEGWSSLYISPTDTNDLPWSVLINDTENKDFNFWKWNFEIDFWFYRDSINYTNLISSNYWGGASYISLLTYTNTLKLWIEWGQKDWKTKIWTWWHYVSLKRDGIKIDAYLDWALEISMQIPDESLSYVLGLWGRPNGLWGTPFYIDRLHIFKQDSWLLEEGSQAAVRAKALDLINDLPLADRKAMLLKALEDPLEDIRLKAVNMIDSLAPEDVKEVIQAALDNSNELVNLEAVKMTWNLTGADFAELLPQIATTVFDWLNSSDPKISSAAEAAMKSLTPENLLATILEWLKSADPNIVASALKAISYLSEDQIDTISTEIKDAISSVINNADPDVGSTALDAISHISESDVAEILPAIESAILTWISSSGTGLSTSAVNALNNLSEVNKMSVISGWLADSDPSIVAGALRALDHITDDQRELIMPDIISGISTIFDSWDASDNAAVTDAIAYLSLVDKIAVITDGFDSSNPEAIAWALNALEHLTDGERATISSEINNAVTNGLANGNSNLESAALNASKYLSPSQKDALSWSILSNIQTWLNSSDPEILKKALDAIENLSPDQKDIISFDIETAFETALASWDSDLINSASDAFESLPSDLQELIITSWINDPDLNTLKESLKLVEKLSETQKDNLSSDIASAINTALLSWDEDIANSAKEAFSNLPDSQQNAIATTGLQSSDPTLLSETFDLLDDLSPSQKDTISSEIVDAVSTAFESWDTSLIESAWDVYSDLPSDKQKDVIASVVTSWDPNAIKELLKATKKLTSDQITDIADELQDVISDIITDPWSPDPDLIKEAFEVLPLLPPINQETLLSEWLESDNPDVVKNVLEEIPSLTPEQIEDLQPVLTDTVTSIMSGWYIDPDTWETFKDLVDAAWDVIPSLSPEDQVAVIEKGLESDNPDVVKNVLEEVWSLTPEQKENLQEKIDGVLEEVFNGWFKDTGTWLTDPELLNIVNDLVDEIPKPWFVPDLLEYESSNTWTLDINEKWEATADWNWDTDVIIRVKPSNETWNDSSTTIIQFITNLDPEPWDVDLWSKTWSALKPVGDTLNVPIVINTWTWTLRGYKMYIIYWAWLTIENPWNDVTGSLWGFSVRSYNPIDIWWWKKKILIRGARRWSVRSEPNPYLEVANIKFKIIWTTDRSVGWEIIIIATEERTDIKNSNEIKAGDNALNDESVSLIEDSFTDKVFAFFDGFTKLMSSIFKFSNDALRNSLLADVFYSTYLTPEKWGVMPPLWDFDFDCELSFFDILDAQDYVDWILAPDPYKIDYWSMMSDVYRTTTSTWLNQTDVDLMNEVDVENTYFLAWITAIAVANSWIELRVFLEDNLSQIVTSGVKVEFEITPLSNWNWIKYRADDPVPVGNIYYYWYTLSGSDIDGVSEVQVVVHVTKDWKPLFTYGWSKDYTGSIAANTFTPVVAFNPSDIWTTYTALYGWWYPENYWDDCNLPWPPEAKNLTFNGPTSNVKTKQVLEARYDYFDILSIIYKL